MVSIAANWKCMRCMHCFLMHADNEVALSYSLMLLECMTLEIYETNMFAVCMHIIVCPYVHACR